MYFGEKRDKYTEFLGKTFMLMYFSKTFFFLMWSGDFKPMWPLVRNKHLTQLALFLGGVKVWGLYEGM